MKISHGTIISINWLKRSHPVLQPLNGRDSFPPSTLLCIHCALFNHTCCSVVWGNCFIKALDKLKKLQNRAARVLTYSEALILTLLFFLSLWMEKIMLSSQRNLQNVLLVYKSIHCPPAEYLLSRFVNPNDITPYSLRDSAKESFSFNYFIFHSCFFICYRVLTQHSFITL